MKLPVTQKLSDNGGIYILDAEGNRVAIVRTTQVKDGHKVNQENADFIVLAINHLGKKLGKK